MPIDIKTAKGIADLARLDLTLGIREEDHEETLSKITEEFSKIVGYMDILEELDTTSVEPMYSPMKEPEAPRKDEPFDEDSQRANAERILSLSPLVSGRFFVVPKVV